MEKIEKILEINHPSFEWVKDFFKNEKIDINHFPVTTNEFIFHNTDFPKGQNHLIELNESRLRIFNNDTLIDKVNECVNFLNEKFNLKFMWLMIYPPKTFLNFHKDHGKNRHVISFCDNDRFFNYEVYNDEFLENDKEKHLNEKLISNIDQIDTFNEYYKNLHDCCKITILDSNSVYTFGDTLHTFFNGSDTIRINLVFEIVE